MVERVSVTQKEVSLSDDEFIVSKTDLKGKLTYINRTFMRISGFPEAELLGFPHNVIRHPDMPRGVFKLMWDTLRDGNEFFGYVKNRCKNGGHYWVFANITIDYGLDNKPVGYYSVRRKPTPRALDHIIPIYREMLAIEAGSSGKNAVEASLQFFRNELARNDTDYLDMMMKIENGELD